MKRFLSLFIVLCIVAVGFISTGICAESEEVSSTSTSISNGVYFIKNTKTSKFVDVENKSVADGRLVQQWSFHGGNTQKWVISKRVDGYYTIRVYGSAISYYLSVKDDSTANNASIVLTGTDELVSATFNPPEFLPGSDVVTEEDYKLFVKDVISQFAQEDFDLYSYKCTTSCEGEDVEHEGFISRAENDTVATYDFIYTVLKGGAETSDRIYVVMFFNADCMSLSFSLNQHDFDNVTVPEINESRLNATISAGIQAHVDSSLTEGNVYDGTWTLDNAKWHMINGVPTYVCNVIVTYKTESGEDSYGEGITFEIQPTVENGDSAE